VIYCAVRYKPATVKSVQRGSYRFTCAGCSAPIVIGARAGSANRAYCVDCGANAVCYDHRDWQKPLEVVPVCRSCNNRRKQAKNLLGGVGA